MNSGPCLSLGEEADRLALTDTCRMEHEIASREDQLREAMIACDVASSRRCSPGRKSLLFITPAP